MKLVRYGEFGKECPALLDDRNRLRDISSLIDDITGLVLSDEMLEKLRLLDPATLPLVEGTPRIGACVGNVGKFVAIGLNYSDHAIEAGMPVPTEPVMFMKATSSICGAYDDVEIPRGSTRCDWEVELGIVIGKAGRDIAEQSAIGHIAGYCVVNDVSERSYQIERGGQWVKGKSLDTFGPIGPWLVTRDEVPTPHALDLWLDVNGVRRQTGNTSTMIFPIPFIVSYVSRFMSLQAGDIITTGTPPGVGMGLDPPVYLAEGDDMRLSIERLGCQRQQVKER